MKNALSKRLHLLLFLLALLLFLGSDIPPAFSGTCQLQAYPETPLEAMLFSADATAHSVSQPDPAKIQIEVGASSGVMLTPSITVAADDAGNSGYLILYLYFPDSNSGFTIPGKSVTLADTQLVDLLPNALDFTDYPGFHFIVYYGYVNDAAAIHYNAYTVTVIPCATTQSPCEGLDQTSCGQKNGCSWIWNTFSTGTCAVNCDQFTDEQSCRAAFDGNSCQWISNFIANTCTNK